MKTPALESSPKLRLLTLCLLYLSQGLPNGFITGTLATYLTIQGCSIKEVGEMTAMALLPWTYKFIWGPIIDRFDFPRLRLGRRRPWIIFAQSMMFITLLALLFIPNLSANWKVLGWVVFVHNMFASLQDVSTDAMSVDLLPENERGKANGFMRASAYVGSMIGGAVMGLITAHYDNILPAIALQVLILACIMMAPLLLRERENDRLFPGHLSDVTPEEKAELQAVSSLKDLFQDLLKAFSLRSTLLAAVLAVLILGGQTVILTTGKILFPQVLGWTMEEIATYFFGYGAIIALCGSLAGGFLADRFGGKQVAIAMTFLLGLTWIVFSQMEGLWASHTFIYAYIVFEQFCIGAMTVALYAVFMGLTWPVIAGTHYTGYMALLCVSLAGGAKIASMFGDHPNFSLIYLCTGIAQILIISMLFFIDPTETRRKLGEG